MTLKTLLAYLPSESSALSALNVASPLAVDHGAHLIGVHAIPPVQTQGPYMAMPLALAQDFDQQRERQEAAIRRVFDDVTNRLDIVTEWRTVRPLVESLPHAVVELGDVTDLLVLAHDDHLDYGSANDRIIELSARPVLLMPNRVDHQPVGERVFVAWDGSRESVSALFSALPVLARASEVRLHRVNLPQADRKHRLGLGEDLAAALARHGVPVEFSASTARSADVGSELLGFAQDMGASLMVMGYYGHSRFRELLLGGASRHVLAHASIPLWLHSG